MFLDNILVFVIAEDLSGVKAPHRDDASEMAAKYRQVNFIDEYYIR